MARIAKEKTVKLMSLKITEPTHLKLKLYAAKKKLSIIDVADGFIKEQLKAVK